MLSFALLATGCLEYQTVSAEESKQLKVANVHQTSASYHSVSLAWDNFSLTETKTEISDMEGNKDKIVEPTDSYFYEIHMAEKTESASNSAVSAEDWSLAATTYDNYISLYDLLPGKTYYIRVIAKTKALPRKTVTNYYDKIAISTVPSQVNAPEVTDLSNMSVSLSWRPSSGANSYFVAGYKGNNPERISFGNTTDTKMTITNLLPGTTYHFIVFAVNDNGKYRAINNSEDDTLLVTTLPETIDAVAIKNDYIRRKAQVLSWNAEAVEGYEITVGSSGSKIKTTYESLTNIYDITKFSNNAWQYAKVRGYITVNGKKKYSSYSKPVYFAKQMQVKKIKQVRKKGNLKHQAKVSWKKIKGSTSYSLYLSKKPTSGFVKIADTKKTSYLVKKYKGLSLRKKKAYYVRVLANKKSGKKKYTAFIMNKYKKFKLK